MTAKTAVIPAHLREVLSRSRVDGAKVVLPGALDRPTYIAVDKVLQDLGGKWDRRAGGHVFADEAGAEAVLAAAAGEAYVSPRANALFVTPSAVVERVISEADLKAGQRVLEPSAGTGVLARAAAVIVGHENVSVIEIQPNLWSGLVDEGFTDPAHGSQDFLYFRPAPAYDRVIMNPPFDMGSDTKHVLHALRFLRPGGRLVAVMSPGWTYRADAEPLRALSPKWITNPDGSFKEAGTMVKSGIVVVDAS